MKSTKKILGIALAVLIVFLITACGEAGSDVITVTRNSIRVNNALVYSSSPFSGGEFTRSLANFTSPVSYVSRGNLTVNLGVPNSVHGHGFPAGIIATPSSARYFMFSGLAGNTLSSEDDDYIWYPYAILRNNTYTVYFYYVEEPLQINGSVEYDTYSNHYNNLSLQEGWNTVLYSSQNIDGKWRYTYTNGQPDSTYYWTLSTIRYNK